MTKRIVLTVFILSISLSIFGQFNRKKWNPLYTEKQKKDLFKEAQKKGDFNDEIFETTRVPLEWKDESVVILAQRARYIGYINRWNNIGYFTYQVRVRIKMQDLTAIENFSTYYFNKEDNIEITIEKPDGERKKIDLKEAIDVEEKVNLAYFGDIEVSKYKKIAFSNLAPGDILDVVSMETVRFNKNLHHWTDIPLFFLPIQATKNTLGILFNISSPFTVDDVQQLNGSYPIVEQKIEFDLGKHFYLNYRALNGAPELEEKISTTRAGNKLWVFHDVMRQKLKDEPWSEPMFTLPAIKYEVTFANRRSRNDINRLIDTKTRLKTTVSEKDIRKMAYKFYRKSRESTGDIYYNYYKKQGYKISNDREFIDGFYNYYRNTKLYEVARFRSDAVYKTAMPNGAFVQYMVKILNKRGIKHSLIMGVPRYKGSMDGLMGENDLMWGIMVYYNNDEVLYTDCDLYARPGEPNPQFEGIKLYEIRPARYKQGMVIDETSIPVTHPSKNQFLYTITAEFLPDFDTLLITRKTELQGRPRYKHREETFSYNSYYKKLREELSNDHLFVREFLYDKKLLKNKRFLDDEEKRIEESFLNRSAKRTRKGLENTLKYDYQVADYKSLKVEKDGLKEDEPSMAFVEEFKLRDLLDATGDGSYVLKVGEFIDGQIEIKDIEDRERQGDIVHPYARTYTYEIEIKIPALMQVSGIEQLNRDVENETGSFKSSAKMQGSSLIIKVEKTYKDIYQSKDKWEDLLKFIDEAVDFRSTKLILTR